MLVLRDSTAPGGHSMLLLKMWLIIIGIYIWEFVTNLHYEWGIIRRHQTHRWTIWIYLLARWATIIYVIFYVIVLNAPSALNCQAWILSSWGFSFLSLCSGSLLLVLRILAIWNRNKVIVAIVTILSVTNISLVLLVVVQIRSVWDPMAKSCRVTNIHNCGISMASSFATDTILLLIMLAGLLRLRHSGRGSYELWDLLWKQGVIWFIVAAVAELPPVVFIALNVDDDLHVLFMFPSVIMTVIATTRMHRSLQYFTSSSTAPDSGDQKTRNSRIVSKIKNPSVVHIPSNRLEVSVHKTYEEYSMSQMDNCGPYPDKPREHDIDDKVEVMKVAPRKLATPFVTQRANVV